MGGELDGYWEKYFENGQLQTKGAYRGGELDGHWEEYYESGQLKIRRTYRR